MSELQKWQERLEEHFADLSMRRSASAEAWPLFALEHGLDDTARRELVSAVQSDIRHGEPSWGGWLPWVVYASEVGYSYEGQEYWSTFGQRTPGWLEYGDRTLIRDFFRQFHRRYRGVEPGGSWADHFSIICWPITHAVLPKDLQQHLARILYDLRWRFTPELLKSPASLGGLIAGASDTAPARFQQLAENSALIGQIATALLTQEDRHDDGPLLGSTLARIRSDLEGVAAARAWLHDARMRAQQTQVRGLARHLLGADGRGAIILP